MRYALSRLTLGLGLASMLAGGALVLNSCQKQGSAGAPPPKGEPQSAPVEVAAAAKTSVPLQLETFGTAEAYTTVQIKSLVAGTVMDAFFKDGQIVQAKDKLFTIDPRPFEAALAQAEANVVRDVANANLKRLEAKRVQELLTHNAATRNEADTADAAAAVADATVKADQAAVDTAKLNLSYCFIQSPVTAVAGEILIKPGNTVKANDVAMVNLNQIEPIDVSFSLPEKELPRVQRYAARNTLEVVAYTPSGEIREQGTLTFLDNTVDKNTGTFMLKGTFANTGRRLWPGLYLNVSLKLADERDVIVVPSQAIQNGQEGTYVFVVEPDRTVRLNPVAVVRMFDGKAIVTGLAAGASVVTNGQLRLAPKMTVEIVAPTSGPASAPAAAASK